MPHLFCRLTRRTQLQSALALTAAVALAGCAGLAGLERPKVSVAGIEPMAGQGMEIRFAVKLRVQNPNNQPIDYDGLFIALSLGGNEVATGVSPDKGSVPRFGEQVLTIPVTVTGLGLLRQVVSMATGSNPGRMDYQLRGRLSGSALGGVSFTDSGQLDLSKLLPRLGGGGVSGASSGASSGPASGGSTGASPPPSR